MFAFLKRTFVVLIGFLLIALFIWYAGPYFAFAEFRPLESQTARLIAIGIVVGLLAARALVQAAALLQAKRSAAGGGGRTAAAGKSPHAGRSREAPGAVRRSGRGVEAAADRREPLRSPVVRDHRAARFGQDHGASQLRAAVSARAAPRQGRAARRRRHAQLRLVVHRRGGLPRHRRPLHHAGFRCGVGQRRVERVPRAAEEVPRAAAAQRRDRDGQRAGSADARPGRARGARRSGAQPPRRVESRAADPAAGLRAGHQVRSGRRVRRVLRRPERRGARPGLGRDVPVRADGRQREPEPLHRGIRRADDAVERTRLSIASKTCATPGGARRCSRFRSRWRRCATRSRSG